MAGLYAPMGVDHGGVAPPSIQNDTVCKVVWWKNNCEVTFENLHCSSVLNALYKCKYDDDDDFSRYDAQTNELPQLLPKQLVRLQDPSTKKWSIPREVIQKAETPNTNVVRTHKGVLRRNQIHMMEAAMPGPQVPTKQAPAAVPLTPKQLIFKIMQPAKTTEIPRTAAKPPSTQSTGLEKTRVAAMPPSEPQPAPPPPVPPPPPMIPSVSVPKPHPVI